MRDDQRLVILKPMSSGATAVLVIGWRELGDLHPEIVIHQRRLGLLRDQLAQQLALLNVPHRILLCDGFGADRSAATRVIDTLKCLDRPVVIACEWDLAPEEMQRLERLHRSGDARVLLISTKDLQGYLPSIIYHQAGTGAEVARHCLAAGYRRLLYLSPFHCDWSDARGEGVIAAARHAGVPVACMPPDTAPIHVDYRDSSPTAQAEQLLRCLDQGLQALGGDSGDLAIIGCNDAIALAVRALRPGLAAGLAGFDDEPLATRSQLTSARPPSEAIARRAAELAARLWRGEGIPTLTELPWDVIARTSTRRATPAGLPRTEGTIRITNPTVMIAKPEPLPPVVLLDWGVYENSNENTKLFLNRLAITRRSLLDGLHRAGIQAAVLAIDGAPDQAVTHERIERAIQRVIAGGVKVAIIQELSLSPTAEALLAEARATGQLHVIRSRGAGPDLDQPTVMHDQGAAGAMAANHLLRRGYTRLLFLAPFTNDWVSERGQVARRALLLASSGISTLLTTPEVTEFDQKSFFALSRADQQRLVGNAFTEGCARLNRLSGEHGPLGVIAANDLVALRLLAVLAERGLKPGTDIGVIGFDDSPTSAPIGLSSMNPPLEIMGAELARLTVRLLQGGTIPRRTCLPWEVAARTSSLRE